MSPMAKKLDVEIVKRDRAMASAARRKVTPMVTVATTDTTDSTGKRTHKVVKVSRQVFRLFAEEEIATIALHIILAVIGSIIAMVAGTFGWEWLHHIQEVLFH